MKVLLFNGSMEPGSWSAAIHIVNYYKEQLEAKGMEVDVIHLATADIPMFDFSHQDTPASVQTMVDAFRSADIHVWMTPLYHGSMTGAMKNCLDWLEISAKAEVPYLMNKIIGMVCWAGGAQAMQGINAMDSVAKSLRAWVMPYSVPIVRPNLQNEKGELELNYTSKFDIMIDLIAQQKSAGLITAHS